MDFSRTQQTVPVSQMNATTFMGGKLVPVGALHYQPNEGGYAKARMTLEAAPLAGRLLSQVNMHVQAVFVPLLAADFSVNEDEWVRGNAEHMRNRLQGGQPIFNLQPESDITKKCGINPVSIAGEKLVSAQVNVSHNCAVTFLRQRVYRDATTVPAQNRSITNALLTSTVLDRLNGVIKPDERIDGAIDFSGNIPVMGIGLAHSATGDVGNPNVRESDDAVAARNVDGWVVEGSSGSVGAGEAKLVVEQDPDRGGFPRIVASFDHGKGHEIKLSAFQQAQKRDSIVRQLERIVRDHPEHGVQMVQRLIHGLNVEWGKECVLLYDDVVQLAKSTQSAMDGPSQADDVTFTHLGQIFEASVVVPKSEFGGMLFFFVSVKPDEIMPDMPHPTLTAPLTGKNLVPQHLAIDPVLVTARELFSDVSEEDEGEAVCWVGPNHLRRSHTVAQYTRDIDLTTVENISSLWQYQIPLGVDADNIVYPDDLPHDPFADRWNDAFHCTTQLQAMISTPEILGPTPIERLDGLENGDLEVPENE